MAQNAGYKYPTSMAWDKAGKTTNKTSCQKQASVTVHLQGTTGDWSKALTKFTSAKTFSDGYNISISYTLTATDALALTQIACFNITTGAAVCLGITSAST